MMDPEAKDESGDDLDTSIVEVSLDDTVNVDAETTEQNETSEEEKSSTTAQGEATPPARAPAAAAVAPGSGAAVAPATTAAMPASVVHPEAQQQQQQQQQQQMRPPIAREVTRPLTGPELISIFGDIYPQHVPAWQAQIRGESDPVASIAVAHVSSLPSSEQLVTAVHYCMRRHPMLRVGVHVTNDEDRAANEQHHREMLARAPPPAPKTGLARLFGDDKPPPPPVLPPATFVPVPETNWDCASMVLPVVPKPWRAVVSEELSRGFSDLSGPLWRVVPVAHDNAHQLVIVFHSVLADASSGHTIIHELLTAACAMSNEARDAATTYPVPPTPEALLFPTGLPLVKLFASKTARFFLERTLHSPPSFPVRHSVSTGPDVCIAHHFTQGTPENFTKVLQVCMQRNVHVASVMAAAVCFLSAPHHIRHGPTKPTPHGPEFTMTINVPVSLRGNATPAKLPPFAIAPLTVPLSLVRVTLNPSSRFWDVVAIIQTALTRNEQPNSIAVNERAWHSLTSDIPACARLLHDLPSAVLAPVTLASAGAFPFPDRTYGPDVTLSGVHIAHGTTSFVPAYFELIPSVVDSVSWSCLYAPAHVSDATVEAYVQELTLMVDQSHRIGSYWTLGNLLDSLGRDSVLFFDAEVERHRAAQAAERELAEAQEQARLERLREVERVDRERSAALEEQARRSKVVVVVPAPVSSTLSSTEVPLEGAVTTGMLKDDDEEEEEEEEEEKKEEDEKTKDQN